MPSPDDPTIPLLPHQSTRPIHHRMDPEDSNSSDDESEIPVPPSSGTANVIPDGLILEINRPVYHQENFDEAFDYVKPGKNKFSFSRPRLTRTKVLSFAKGLLPPLEWLPKYQKDFIFKDLIAGFTVCVLSVPQAMAYATLANVPAVVGLYTAMITPLIYAIFGTSKQIVFGMFAVPSLMVGHIVTDMTPPEAGNWTTAEQEEYSIQICVTISFCLGLIFVVVAIAQLHVLTAYLSHSLVAGFTTAASIHVLASQIPKLIAVKVTPYRGLFKLIYIARDVILGLPTLNPPDLIISVFSIALLMFGRYIVNAKLSVITQIPIPFELIVVVATTLLSSTFNFNTIYNVKVVGIIPKGLPTPMMPAWSKIPAIFVKTLPIAVVIFGVTLSVLKLFSKKHDYRVNPAQDIRALAIVFFTTCFFRCHPGCGSLSRSALMSQMGNKSQFGSIISSIVTFIVVMWAGPWMYHLPICALAAIIFVALQTVILQLRELPRLWKVSRVDFAIWAVSFFATFLYDVSEGLMIAVVFGLMTVIIRIQIPKSIALGRIPTTELYRDFEKYRKAEPMSGIIVLRYDSPLLFVNAERFVETAEHAISDQFKETPEDGTTVESNQESTKLTNGKRYLILDVSGIVQVDQMGVEALKDVHLAAKKCGTSVLIAAPKSPVRDLFAKCDLYTAVPKSAFFPSVHDAVLFVQHELVS
uniref:STAS domain-containing protein n=1 Tax=Panagrellus redivivus TaxID=6233 RepID=A0A7E4V4X0_PANRE